MYWIWKHVNLIDCATLGFQQCLEGDRVCCTSLGGFRLFFPFIRESRKDPGWTSCLSLSGCCSPPNLHQEGCFLWPLTLHLVFLGIPGEVCEEPVNGYAFHLCLWPQWILCFITSTPLSLKQFFNNYSWIILIGVQYCLPGTQVLMSHLSFKAPLFFFEFGLFSYPITSTLPEAIYHDNKLISWPCLVMIDYRFKYCMILFAVILVKSLA